MQDISIAGPDILTVSGTETSKSSMYYVLQHLKKNLANVVIKVTAFFSTCIGTIVFLLKKGGLEAK